jgi:hypothetical protein
MPMVRTILPPIELCCWPNTCSTRARTFERVVFADFWRSDSGRSGAVPPEQQPELKDAIDDIASFMTEDDEVALKLTGDGDDETKLH